MPPNATTDPGKIPACPKDGCGFKCCHFDQGNYIVLYPGELDAVPPEATRHLEIIDPDYCGGQKAVCTLSGHQDCGGGYKPLDCRTYPYFPDEHGHLTLRGSKCPLTSMDLVAHRARYEKVWAALYYSGPRLRAWLACVELVGYERLP
jgi:hypothetical protein